MFFAYVDESGDTGMTGSPTSTFVLSCLLLHDRDWLSALDQTISFRRYLRDEFHIAPRSELKASWLIHNKGDIRHSGLSYPARLQAYRAAMRFQRKVGVFRIFSILIAKSRITKTPSDVREFAWRYAVQRLERFGTATKDNVHVLPDEGHGDFIRKKIRLMRRFNYVPSAFGGATLERHAENIVEDSSDRRSQESFFIQLADLNAYAAYRKVFPGATFGEEMGRIGFVACTGGQFVTWRTTGNRRVAILTRNKKPAFRRAGEVLLPAKGHGFRLHVQYSDADGLEQGDRLRVATSGICGGEIR